MLTSVGNTLVNVLFNAIARDDSRDLTIFANTLKRFTKMRRYHKTRWQLQVLDFKDKFEQIGSGLLEVDQEHRQQVVSQVNLEATTEIHCPHRVLVL